MLDQTNESPLLDIRSVCRSFPKGSGEDLLVLEKVHLAIHLGEIVSLLGRSGPANRRYCGSLPILSRRPRAIRNAVAKRSLGHRTVSPWYSSRSRFSTADGPSERRIGTGSAWHQQRGTPHPCARRDRSDRSRWIRVRLSQRVVRRHATARGFTRAPVVHPDLLLMDEPFSALDVLTAETLRTDLIDL
jgi:NitT/TauT family transport system ATP-binding protein